MFKKLCNVNSCQVGGVSRMLLLRYLMQVVVVGRVPTSDDHAGREGIRNFRFLGPLAFSPSSFKTLLGLWAFAFLGTLELWVLWPFEDNFMKKNLF